MFALLDDYEPNYYFLYVSNDLNDRINDYKAIFYNVGEKFKKEPYIRSGYNKICQLNFNKTFDDSRRILISKPSKELFEDKLPEELESNIMSNIGNQIIQLKNFTGYQMWGETSEDKTEVLEFGKCSVLLIKHIVAQWPAEDVRYYLGEVSKIIRNRAYYLYMQILTSWGCDVVNVQPDCIVDEVKNIVKNHPEKYVLVDYDSHAGIFLSRDRKDFRHQKCEGIDYVMCNCIDYLKDTFFYKQLEGRLYLILKDDLPALIRTVDTDVDITLKDQSNYEKQCMDLRIDIDSKYVIKYRKNVKITAFELLPMNMN